MDNSADSKILEATNGDSAPTRVIAMVIGGQVRSAEKLSDGHIAFHVEDLPWLLADRSVVPDEVAERAKAALEGRFLPG